MTVIPVAYLASTFLSLLGNSIAAVALPLIVLQVTGSVLGAGAVAAATAVPAILAGLFAGVIIDRVNRRTASIASDVISALAVAALPVVDLVWGLNLGWFVILGIVGALGDVPGMTARETLLPAIVRHGRWSAERLIGVREALGAIAILLGPALAGVLLVMLDGAGVLWVTAATSFAAALITLLLPRRIGALADSAVSHTNGWSQLREGWRVLAGSRFLVVTTSLSLLSVLVLASMQALILPVYFTLEGEPGLLGLVLSALAAGMLVGGALYAVAGTRGSRRGWFLTGLLGSTAGFALIGALPSVWVVLAGAAVVGLAAGVFNSLIGVLMIERIPEALRGRILGTQNAVLTAAPPVGIVLAAVLTEYAGVDTAAVLLASVWLIALVVGIAARSLRSLEPVTDTDAG
ncbi:MFS family permease [Microbacterium sp. SORGH_AS428]|uniref:MFS transporter n=1 Tax=Microbacterium sp. SORGH_AS_0428 TaxID=3041788 RepID=UPI00285ADEC8|nr:MFS transporter [Microbacterium sp. SORGH_AS_0428]MDR6201262.1 MFS family permease [Microbacterium sp. SORGH_AS_0428]